MRIGRNLRLSIRALAVHRVRTALALASAATGVAGVVLLTSIGNGAKQRVLEQIDRLGRNTLMITPARVESKAGRALQSDIVLTLREQDGAALPGASRAIRRVAPVHNREMRVRHRRLEAPATVIATTPEWLDIRNFRLAAGRNFTDHEKETRARVAVIGAQIHGSLFGDSIEAIGSIIRLGRVPFTIVGVLRPVGSSIVGGGSEDDRIIIPLETGLSRLFNRDELRMLLVEATAASAMSSAADDAAAVLRARHEIPPGAPDDFEIRDPILLLEAELSARTSFQRLMTGLAVLSLFVGATGILSIMVLAVRERRTEIGLRTAIGARRLDIATQFLAESMIIASAGGAMGAVGGMIGRIAIARLTDWPLSDLVTTLVWTSGSVVVLGVVAGFLPALRAARLDPIVSLRSSL